mmetsp:Transcript_25640/g.61046  ORF Transcript_25640/g.61046 Transcript_25640/m.61046 type:complete len:211 (+) Transcript_25640:932-1564(+)
MGGMGGFGGMDDMDGFMGMPGRGRPRGPQKPPPIERQLLCTLEELYKGSTRRLKITRSLLDQSGQRMRTEEVLTIDVKPGWKKGTKITFAGRGDEHPNQEPADVVFIIDEKPHATFRRDGNDLVYKHTVPLVDALCGTTVQLTALDGRSLRVPLSRPMAPGERHVVSGEGMPISKSPGQRGDLRIELDVRFPRHLSDAQKQAVRQALPRS